VSGSRWRLSSETRARAWYAGDMRKPSDPVSSVDWSTVPEATAIGAVASVVRAQYASNVFHVAAYAWLAISLFTVFALRPAELQWGVIASGVTALGLARLGIWARSLRRERDRTLAALATEHPSKS